MGKISYLNHYKLNVRIITLNLNGIRSSVTKGSFDWLKNQDADVVCLQEVRAGLPILEQPLYHLPGYHSFYHPAQKSGYSGVGILCKQKPLKVVQEIGLKWADEEGRYLHVEFENCVVVSVYFPSGTSGDHRQILKYEFLEYYYDLLQKHLNDQRHWIIAGDVNIAHKKIDLKNWRANQTRTGFLPEERAWLDKTFDAGWIDTFREVNQEADQYTWWSHWGQARKNNVGWRIDYQIASPSLKNKIKNASIYKEEFFSDHAPLILEYDI